MNVLRKELHDHKELLNSFKKLPQDLKVYIQSFYKSSLPTLRCPCCQKYHYPLYCYHYCKRACYALALKRLVLNEAEYAFLDTRSDSSE